MGATTATSSPARAADEPRRLRDLLAVALAGAGLFLLVALASHEQDTHDPAVAGSDWAGPVGAAAAGLLARAFGVVAWLAVVELALAARAVARTREPLDSGRVALHVSGDLALGVVLAALAQLLFPAAASFGGLPVGGNVGLLFGELTRGAFSTLGGVLVTTTVVSLVLVGRNELTVDDALRAAHWAGATAVAASRRVRQRLGLAWAEARELRAAQAAEAREAPRAAPRVVSQVAAPATLFAGLPEDEDEWLAPDEEAPAPPPAAELPADELSTDEPPPPPLRIRVSRGGAEPPAPPSDEPAALELLTGPASPRPAAVSRAPATPAAVSRAPATPAAVSRAPAAPAPRAPAEVAPRPTRAEPPARQEDAGVRRGVIRLAEVSDEPLDSGVQELLGAADDSAYAGADDAGGDDGPPSGVAFASAAVSDDELDPEEELDAAFAAESALDHAAGELSDAPPREFAVTDARAEPARPPSRAPRVARPRGRRFQLPLPTFLEAAGDEVAPVDEVRIAEIARELEGTLAHYKVEVKVVEALPGPTVTTYEALPRPGTKVSTVSRLDNDLALSLGRRVRIIAPIPGKSRVGFEVENEARVPVNLRELVEHSSFAAMASKVPLPVILGRDIVGNPFYADLASMPHVIVAGATGSGKSVGLNVMLASLLFQRTPDDLRLLMIDPKMVELAPFGAIPHMLLPVVTDMKQAATALKWAVDEMERRYQLLADAGKRNIVTYNAWVDKIRAGEVQLPLRLTAMSPDGVPVDLESDDTADTTPPERLPYIVIVVDEFSDLMMQQGKDVEAAVARLAQKARAAGMHVILATQRPSVDVITGMIKANFPTRIAFQVAQSQDSKTILDAMGAQNLLGRGDMLVKLNGRPHCHRVQCPYISEEEVEELTRLLRLQGKPDYNEDILRAAEDDDDGDDDGEPRVLDKRFDEAVELVARHRKCSTSWLQRKMGIGYGRASRIVDEMERQAMVGLPVGAGKDREVFLPPPSL